MTLSISEWAKYRDLLSKLSQKASDEFRDAIWSASGRFHGVGLGAIPREDVIDYAYALVTKYSEGSSELACQMYDKIATMSGKKLPPAEPAQTANYFDVKRSIDSAIKTSFNPDYISSRVGNFVKQASQDTTLKNAQRDGAEFAWIPSGDACAFCTILASNGWRTISKKSSSHAEHIHPNCTCAYTVRFDSKSGVAGYDPDKYYEEYKNAEGKTPKEKLNSMRRMQYQENKDRINSQKRVAYELRTNLDVSNMSLKEYTSEEIKKMAESTESVIQKYIDIPSKWSGNIVISPNQDDYYKAWNCDIVSSRETAPSILMHEQIHARSVSYWDDVIFANNQGIEEASVQLLTQEICKKESIEIIPSGYDNIVNELIKINETYKLYDSNYEYSQKLISISLPARNKWLERKVMLSENTDLTVFNESMRIINEYGIPIPD